MNEPVKIFILQGDRQMATARCDIMGGLARWHFGRNGETLEILTMAVNACQEQQTTSKENKGGQS